LLVVRRREKQNLDSRYSLLVNHVSLRKRKRKDEIPRFSRNRPRNLGLASRINCAIPEIATVACGNLAMTGQEETHFSEIFSHYSSAGFQRSLLNIYEKRNF
jgi:hypothetical protein